MSIKFSDFWSVKPPKTTHTVMPKFCSEKYYNKYGTEYINTRSLYGVQNFVESDAVVLIICHFSYFASLLENAHSCLGFGGILPLK